MRFFSLCARSKKYGKDFKFFKLKQMYKYHFHHISKNIISIISSNLQITGEGSDPEYGRPKRNSDDRI